jgi:hypothetical protein
VNGSNDNKKTVNRERLQLQIQAEFRRFERRPFIGKVVATNFSTRRGPSLFFVFYRFIIFLENVLERD